MSTAASTFTDATGRAAAEPALRSLDLLLADVGRVPPMRPQEQLASPVASRRATPGAGGGGGRPRLVVSVAKRYAGRGVPLEDLVQEGVIGLMRAVDLFDHRRGRRSARTRRGGSARP